MSFYDVLGVRPEARGDEVRTAYKALAARWHPDRADGDALKFKGVSEAYSVLSDNAERAKYDARLRQEQNAHHLQQRYQQQQQSSGANYRGKYQVHEAQMAGVRSSMSWASFARVCLISGLGVAIMVGVALMPADNAGNKNPFRGPSSSLSSSAASVSLTAKLEAEAKRGRRGEYDTPWSKGKSSLPSFDVDQVQVDLRKK